MSGIERIPLNIPTQWDPKWFIDFVRDVLAKADARNALAGAGITILGDPTAPATIGLSGDGASVIDAIRTFLPPQIIPAVQGGTDVTVSRNLLGFVINPSADDATRILAGQIFGRHH